jgi:hypothetical protein
MNSPQAYWRAAMNWAPTAEQLVKIERIVRRTGSIAELWLKVAVIGAALFLACEIVPAFFHGGAVDRVLAGGR